MPHGGARRRTDFRFLPTHNGHSFRLCLFFFYVFYRKPMTLPPNCAILESLLCAMRTQTPKKRAAAPVAATQ